MARHIPPLMLALVLAAALVTPALAQVTITFRYAFRTVT